MWWGRLVLTICKVHLCTPFILTSLLARLVIANLHWFIPAIYSPQGTEVIHPWKNLSYSPFFYSRFYLWGNRGMEFLPLVCPAQKPRSPKPSKTEKYGFANSWDGDLKITMRNRPKFSNPLYTDLNRHKQLPDLFVPIWQGKRQWWGRAGTWQRSWTDSDRWGWLCCAQFWLPQSKSSAENPQEVQWKLLGYSGSRAQDGNGGAEGAGLPCPGKQRPGTGLCLHSSYKDDSQVQGR